MFITLLGGLCFDYAAAPSQSRAGSADSSSACQRIRTFDLLVPNQWRKSHKSLSWRHLLVFGPLSNGQVGTSHRRMLARTLANSFENGSPTTVRLTAT